MLIFENLFELTICIMYDIYSMVKLLKNLLIFYEILIEPACQGNFDNGKTQPVEKQFIFTSHIVFFKEPLEWETIN